MAFSAAGGFVLRVVETAHLRPLDLPRVRYIRVAVLLNGFEDRVGQECLDMVRLTLLWATPDALHGLWYVSVKRMHDIRPSRGAFVCFYIINNLPGCQT